MTIPFLDLKKQYGLIQAEIDDAVQRVLLGGQYILVPEVAAFENEFAEYCGVSHGIGVGSGTEALHLALLACDIGPEDRVITAPNTAVPTVAAICLSGAEPVSSEGGPFLRADVFLSADTALPMATSMSASCEFSNGSAFPG